MVRIMEAVKAIGRRALARINVMRRDIGPKAKPGAIPKPSAVELAVLLVLCPLAGVGAGLAFESVLIGLMVAGLGLLAVATYGLATHLKYLPRNRREDSRRLSVTDISTRRRAALVQQEAPRDERAPASASEPDEVCAVDPNLATAAHPDRIVLFPMPSVRQV